LITKVLYKQVLNGTQPIEREKLADIEHEGQQHDEGQQQQQASLSDTRRQIAQPPLNSLSEKMSGI
jgi:hypothetical protein